MAWTTPATWVAGSYITAAQLNQQLRDNMLQLAPALATTAGRLFMTTGGHAIAERAWETAEVATAETTASTSYADLATVGPSVTLTTGTMVIVGFGAQMSDDTATTSGQASVAVSGATTIAASDTYQLRYEFPSTANINIRDSVMTLIPVNAGSNTFKLQYKVSGGTGTFQRRAIQVLSL